MLEIASFDTDPEPCPYLRTCESTQTVKVVAQLSPEAYARTLSEGWRLFGRGLFKPTCRTCAECIPIRIVTDAFKPSKSQRRNLRRNEDVDVEIGSPRLDDVRMRLYERYHRERSKTRQWFYRDLSPDEYVDTFIDNAAPTLEFRYRLGGYIVGIAYVGVAADALNSVYAYFEPALRRRGLGTFDVLTEVAEAQRRGLPYLYLGFYVRACSSMAYKANFKPYQVLRGGQWRDAGLPVAGDDQ